MEMAAEGGIGAEVRIEGHAGAHLHAEMEGDGR